MSENMKIKLSEIVIPMLKLLNQYVSFSTIEIDELITALKQWASDDFREGGG